MIRHLHPIRRSRITAVASFSLPLAFSAGLVGALTTEAGAAGPSVTDVRRCHGSVGGNAVQVQLSVTYAALSGPRLDDVRSISVRATDNAESDSFRSRRVDVRRIQVSIVNASQSTTIRPAQRFSLITLPANPDRRDSGKDALKVQTTVKFRSGDRVGEVRCNQATF